MACSALILQDVPRNNQKPTRVEFKFEIQKWCVRASLEYFGQSAIVRLLVRTLGTRRAAGCKCRSGVSEWVRVSLPLPRLAVRGQSRRELMTSSPLLLRPPPPPSRLHFRHPQEWMVLQDAMFRVVRASQFAANERISATATFYAAPKFWVLRNDKPRAKLVRRRRLGPATGLSYQ